MSKFDITLRQLKEGFGLNNTNPQQKAQKQNLAASTLKGNDKLKNFVAPDGKVDIVKITDTINKLPDGDEKKTLQQALAMLTGDEKTT